MLRLLSQNDDFSLFLRYLRKYLGAPFFFFVGEQIVWKLRRYEVKGR